MKYHIKTHFLIRWLCCLLSTRRIIKRTLPLMLTDNTTTGWKSSFWCRQILCSHCEYNEMGIYAAMRTVQTDAKHVERICNQSPTRGPGGHAVLIKSDEKQKTSKTKVPVCRRFTPSFQPFWWALTRITRSSVPTVSPARALWSLTGKRKRNSILRFYYYYFIFFCCGLSFMQAKKGN